MNCTKCGQWNPDDKHVCWRCQAELPKPVEPKKKKTPTMFLGLPVWSWAILVFFLILMFAGQCLGPLLLQGQ